MKGLILCESILSVNKKRATLNNGLHVFKNYCKTNCLDFLTWPGNGSVYIYIISEMYGARVESILEIFPNDFFSSNIITTSASSTELDWKLTPIEFILVFLTNSDISVRQILWEYKGPPFPLLENEPQFRKAQFNQKKEEK